MTDLAIPLLREKRGKKPDTPEKAMLRKRARELHAQGWSYPEIAHELGMSVSGAWNLVNREPGE